MSPMHNVEAEGTSGEHEPRARCVNDGHLRAA